MRILMTAMMFLLATPAVAHDPFGFPGGGVFGTVDGCKRSTGQPADTDDYVFYRDGVFEMHEMQCYVLDRFFTRRGETVEIHGKLSCGNIDDDWIDNYVVKTSAMPKIEVWIPTYEVTPISMRLCEAIKPRLDSDR